MAFTVKCDRCNSDSIDTTAIRGLLIAAISAARERAAGATGGAKFEYQAIASEIDDVLKRCFIASA